MRRFLCPPAQGALVAGARLQLDPAASRHLLRVVALRPMGPPSPVIKRFALAEQVTFLHKGGIFAALEELSPDVRVEIDATACARLDPDVLDSLHEFAENKPMVRLVGFPARPGAAAH